MRRKIARHFTREYDLTIRKLMMEKDGSIEFAEWNNPLAPEVDIRQETVDFFRKFIKEGDLVIDIGTNIGDTTVPMGIAAGAAGMTLGFDPNPVVFKIVVKNSSLNKDKTNIVPYRYAVTAEEEEFYFVSSEASFANGGISKTRKSRHGRFIYPEKVKGVNLMDFLIDKYDSWLSKLSFIKIDTEGYDKEIIKSISKLVDKYKPVLVAESFGKSSNEEKLELYDLIKEHGYKIYYFSDFDSNAEIFELKEREDIIKWEKTINIYSIPE